ncbi:MAG: polysaccharide biosynthesis/export family protein [Verrucomicrobiales bacterium]|nr:polysaccharide biosynthesis/export family protein [Verrucomicrobiales bacterium]
MKALKFHQLNWMLLCTALLGLAMSGCTPGQSDHASGGKSRGSFFKSKSEDRGKEIPCHKEVCAEPEFECVKIEQKISSSLLKPPAGKYRVGPGDELDIEIAEDAQTRATARVMPDGMLYYNVANGINVKGMTIREVSDALASNLSYDYVDPIVTVNVANADSQRFWILGQVKNPGTFPLKKPTTLIAALSQSEGLGVSSFGNESEETVDLSRAILIRDKKLIPVDFEALIEGGDMSQNVYIHPNDYIYLPSRQSNAIYVLGAVNSPGAVFYDSDASLLSAISSAGGPRADAVVTKAMIIRGSTREPNVSVVNIQHLMRGTAPNLKVKGGDIIWIPRSMWTNVKNYTESVLTTAAQAIAVQEGLATLGSSGSAGVTITAGN